MGDGNCLFRSLSDQMVSESNEHLEYRNQVTSYIFVHSKDFKPFFPNSIIPEKRGGSLETGYVCWKRKLVAFARILPDESELISKRSRLWRHPTAIIAPSALPVDAAQNLTQSSRESKDRHELHICYHSYPHYSSVRLIGDARGKTLTMIRLSELFEKYTAATKANLTSSDQNNIKIPKLVKLSSVLYSTATTEAESECAVSRRILAAVDI
ncbi:hypothetical protein GJ496_001410 [Pomphorhynchus laevis]|nr:hypothetical protein GJ496_001410 [Pomphorhynchus laevis]